MRRNLIRQNLFGTKRTVRSPMVRPRTWQSSRRSSEIQPGGSEIPRSSFGHVSTLLICLGQDNFFHYLCKTQYHATRRSGLWQGALIHWERVGETGVFALDVKRGEKERKKKDIAIFFNPCYISPNSEMEKGQSAGNSGYHKGSR
jgi:hypothetical protein